MTAGAKAAAVIAAAFLLHRARKGDVKTGGASLSRATVTPDVYTPGSPANVRFNAAQDAWYAQHPDEPFINDDGTVNLLPGYTL